ncbi:ABC transporter permease subunit [Paenibacillus sp. J5C_2022]|uniref:ABC transporter permease n=1 Tax=Paenibacillus sp. J5C2022 TaxID=2977129 RepID=UPI0021D32100|nr:ABC transporter permease subunit [Paenibacillus sp. J5C2022]MCU6711853.1 ABC transporter permease subunit [Paenibacillus sp. J5C2022]
MSRAWKHIRRDRYLYLFLLPVIAYYLIFKYLPLSGEIIAFKDYKINKGFLGSEWVGLKYYKELFASSEFYLVLKNTLLLNLYGLVFGFPAPIALALLLNEVRHNLYKRTIQSILYIPHFISWVILSGMVIAVLSPSTGIVNFLLNRVFGIEPTYFMISPFWWPIVYVLSGIWQGAGWGTILYLAAMSNIDPQLYEAARIDGARKLRQIWHITLPGIRSIIALLLILNVGHFLSIGFEHVYAMQNDLVLDVAEVISTYVYKQGILSMNYSYTTALGLFQSLVGFILVMTVNKIVKALGEQGIW